MEICNVIFSKDITFNDNKDGISTSMYLTLNSKGEDGWYNHLDVNFLYYEDLTKMHNILDKFIKEQEHE